jgi:hypothetical protein
MLLVSVTVAPLNAEAQRAATKTIISTAAPLSKSKITIDASKTKGAFRNIRLVNRGSRIIIKRLRITYSDGTFDEVRKRFSLKYKEGTRVLSSGSNAKFVDKIAVDYVRRGRTRRKAQLVFTGTQTRRESRLNRNNPGAIGSSRRPREDTEVLFGYRNVDFKVDRDEISLGRKAGKFESLKLKVFGDHVFVRDIRVDYLDGSIKSVPFDTLLKKGQQSDWFEVDGSKFIEKLVLIYRARPGRNRDARIEVAGQYADKWLYPTGEGRKYNEGWVLLGSETAGTLGYDTDTINIADNRGGFKDLRLIVRDRSITLREVRVIYESGQEEAFKMNRRLDPGQIAGPFRLKTGPSEIQQIKCRYRTRLFFGKGKGTAVVEIWGRH